MYKKQYFEQFYKNLTQFKENIVESLSKHNIFSRRDAKIICFLLEEFFLNMSFEILINVGNFGF